MSTQGVNTGRRYAPGERVRISFVATITGTDVDNGPLACLGGFNGGYSFLIPREAAIESVTPDGEPQAGERDSTALEALRIALEGECDPRREPERGGRLDGLLDGLSDEQLDALRDACDQLAVAAVCAQMRNYGFKPVGTQ